MQDDILFALFTVREALTFAARLKLKVSIEEQDKKVEDIIMDLGLSGVSQSLIGNERRKVLSGGERKRTSIGVELISDPSVILLDEPTSGLDSFKALGIVKLLNEMARKRGKTVCSTIHSPGSEAFFYFDRLILMCDGNIVYQGTASGSVAYFRNEMKYDVPRFINPADFFMKELSIKYPKTAEDEKKLTMLNNSYRISIQRRIETENNLI
jgi:ABC-type multidrug transport system ATPase subunit